MEGHLPKHRGVNRNPQRCKMLIPPELICSFSVILVNIQAGGWGKRIGQFKKLYRIVKYHVQPPGSEGGQNWKAAVPVTRKGTALNKIASPM